MSTDYTHFSKLAFDTLFARGVDGSETQIFSGSGALTLPSPLKLSTGGSVGAPALQIGTSATGIYSSAANVLNFVTNSTSQLQIDTSKIQALLVFQAADVGYVFSNSNGSGMILGSGNAVQLMQGGSTQLRLNGTSMSASVAILEVDGTAALPAYTFSNAQSTGIYKFGANSLGFSSNGLTAGNIDASQNWTFAAGVTVTGATTLATSLTGVVKATAGVISAATLVDADVSGSAAIAGSKLAAASSSASGVVSTAAQSYAGAKSFKNGIVGVTDASSATAGNLGEELSTTQTTLQNAPTSTQYGDITSVALTAGDWILFANAEGVLNTGTGLTDMTIGIGTTTGNSSAGATAGVTLHTVPPATSNYNASCTIAGHHVKISSPTTYYLKMAATYSGGAPQFRGKISAIRIR